MLVRKIASEQGPLRHLDRASASGGIRDRAPMRRFVCSILCIRLFHIADDGLPTVVYVDVVDVDKLLPAVT